MGDLAGPDRARASHPDLGHPGGAAEGVAPDPASRASIDGITPAATRAPHGARAPRPNSGRIERRPRFPLPDYAFARIGIEWEVVASELEKGITPNGEGQGGKRWNILGQTYFPKATGDTTFAFAFETNSQPGQFVPVHVHPMQDEIILVQEGELDLKLDGVWSNARAGDLVRMPKGIPHGYFNKSDEPVRALFWVSPARKLEALFERLHEMTDTDEIARVSADHEVEFLPPEAND